MRQSTNTQQNKTTAKASLSLWKSIILIILFVFGVVSLFGVILFLFISGAQQLGWSPLTYVIIFVVISGIFAWLVKRISDTISSMSHLWFPEEFDEEN